MAQLQFIRQIKLNTSVIILLFSIGYLPPTYGKPKVRTSPVFAVIAVDAKDASVLYQHNIQAKTPPASLTKLMTLLMVFDALDQKRIQLTDKIPVSKRAAGQPPCKIGIHPSCCISVQEIILSMVTKSANDSACAIAEFLGGSETNFARHMTKRAAEFGMKNTVFKNASGLPAVGQVTTAEDMAILGLIAFKHYQKHLSFFKTQQFCFHKKCHINHNYRLLSNKAFKFNGLKTGYTDRSRFNVISSHRNKHHQDIIIVVLGGASPLIRDQKVIEIAKQIEKNPNGSSHLASSGTPNHLSNLSLGFYASKLRAEAVIKQAISHIKTKTPPQSRIQKIQEKGRTLYQAILLKISEEDSQHISGVLSYFNIPCEKVK